MPNKPKVVDDWKRVFKTYSFWMYVAAVILTLVEQILPFMGLLEPSMSAATYGVIVFCLNLLGIILRFIKQPKLYLVENQSDTSTK